MREGFTKASGKVTIDGNPVPNASVQFITSNGTSFGRTDDDGEFTMQYSNTLVGSAIGETKVSVTTTATFLGEDLSEEDLSFNEDTEALERKELVPKKYASPETTDYVIDVQPGGSPYLIELKSDG